MDIGALHKHLEALGVDVVKADLINGGLKYVGGPPEVREEARRWVREQEGKANKIIGSTISCCGVAFNWRELFKWVKASASVIFIPLLSLWRRKSEFL